ncbi:MAG: tetratricopeptide repeat protein [bacterium]|nr:tetratricopeptide repeat protein [bacterium]
MVQVLANGGFENGGFDNGSSIDIKETVLSNRSFGPHEIDEISYAISTDWAQFGILRDSSAELADQEELTPASAVRLGVCQFLLGKSERAADTLAKADGGALAHFYLAKAHFAAKRYQEAVEAYQSAQKGGYNKDACALGICEALRNYGDAEGALKALDELSGAIEQTAEYLYERGATVAALGGNPNEVIALYERAVATGQPHAGALFGLALENDRRGNDDEALDLYERAIAIFPAHVGSLLNLGLLYEDREDFDRAQSCYQRILEVYPGHERARLYARDAGASSNMTVDDEERRRQEQLNQVLSIPVTDFELSVRARNCLESLGIRTIGDLTKISETELLASKNFGETSLVELRERLGSKGLSIGQFVHDRRDPEPNYDTSHMSADQQALLERPIQDLKLSVRARKCLVRVGIVTIGDLTRKTTDDLLECKNFGVTSLNEIREKLSEFELSFRDE